MARPSSIARKTVRRHVTLPGILAATIEQRRLEFGYPSFPPFALELICFDLRKRREHVVTLPFARETRPVQEALDRELVRQYVPGSERRGLLVQAVLCEVADAARDAPRGDYAVHRDYVHYSETLRPCIETRWRETGYPNFSAYLTAVIRYDLMLLGPHKYHSGEATGAKLLADLDANTVAEFHDAKPKRLYLDHLLEQAAGRPLTDTDRRTAMLALAADLRQRALEAELRASARARAKAPAICASVTRT